MHFLRRVNDSIRIVWQSRPALFEDVDDDKKVVARLKHAPVVIKSTITFCFKADFHLEWRTFLIKQNLSL